MNKLFLILFATIIFDCLLVPKYINALTNGEDIALTDMYNQWNNTLGWTLPVSNACVNWTGITCSSNNVQYMYVLIRT